MDCQYKNFLRNFNYVWWKNGIYVDIFPNMRGKKFQKSRFVTYYLKLPEKKSFVWKYTKEDYLK